MIISEETGFLMLCAAVRDTIGLNLESYKSKQLERRLFFFRQRYNIDSNADLARRLKIDAEMRKHFADFITINVTEFFRNAERFEALRQRYLPVLLQQQPLNIWSAGCSNGAEVYTILLVLAELAPGSHHHILATDIDEASLEKAASGTYTAQEIKEVPQQMRKRFFNEVNDSFTVLPQLRKQVQLKRHDLLRDPFPINMDLILCRNVVIYFTQETKTVLYRKFTNSLRPGGYLFIGATESIFEARSIGLRYVEPCFYEKPIHKA